jgi:photosystem II stability/assembly factor-like uncharacterized protein
VRLMRFIQWTLAIAALSMITGTAEAGFDAWGFEGPEGGEVLSLTVQPGTGAIYAGTLTGGIYRSEDLGRSWHADDPRRGGVLDLESTATTVYAFVQFAGVLQRTAAGWEPRSDGLPPSQLAGDLEIHPTNAQMLWLATRDGLFRSTDGAASWQPVTSGALAGGDDRLTDVEIHPLDPALMLVAASSDGVYRSLDGGATWTFEAGAPAEAIDHLAVDPVDRDGAYLATGGDLYRTQDAGETWQLLGDVAPDGVVTSLEVRGDGRLFVGTSEGRLLTSADHGQSLQEQAAPSPTSIQALAFDSASLARLLVGDARGFHVRDAPAAPWQTRVEGLRATFVAELDRDPATGFLYASTPGGLYRSRTRGLTWEVIGEHFAGKLSSFVAAGGSRLYVVTFDGLEVSTDDGATWTPLAGTVPPDVFFDPSSILDMAVPPGQPSTLYLGGFWFGFAEHPVLLRSTDGGATFEAVYTPDPAVHFLFQVNDVAVDPHDPSHVMAGVLTRDQDIVGGGLILDSTDGGATWSETELFDELAFPDVAFDPATAGVVYTAASSGPLMRSDDGGATWAPVAGPDPAVDVRTVAVSPSGDRLFIALDDGRVFVSPDGGLSWSEMPTEDVATLSELLPVTDGLLYGASLTGVVSYRDAAEACAGDGSIVCLDGGRFAAEAAWATPQRGAGRATAVDLTGNTAYFWFFNPDNIELVLKVHDACVDPFDRFWVFAAGLTNVELTVRVTDIDSGESWWYRNPQGTAFPPVLDTQAFDTCPAGGAASTVAGRGDGALAAGLPDWARASLAEARRAGPAPARVTAADHVECADDETHLCLGGRFLVSMDFRTPQGASGAAKLEPLTDDTAYAWFFNEANVEVILKVLDACQDPFNRYWVFAAGLTNVEVDIHVLDTVTDEEWTHTNDLGSSFAPVQDTDAFNTCS